MGDTKHTPGPLKVTREVDSDGYCQHTVRTAGGGPVAVLSNYSPIEQRANADLYAAAPELLEALIELRRCVESGTAPAMGRVHAAIANATGSAS